MCVFFLNELFTFVIMCVCGFFYCVVLLYLCHFVVGYVLNFFLGGGGILINKRKTIFWLIKVHKIIKCTKVKSCSRG